MISADDFAAFYAVGNKGRSQLDNFYQGLGHSSELQIW